jgi:chorismate mutase
MSTMTAQHSPAGSDAPEERQQPADPPVGASDSSVVDASSGPDATETTDAGTPARPVAASAAKDTPQAVAERAPSIDEMRMEIDAIDSALVRLILRRTELSHAIGAARQSQGGTRIVYSREIQVLERFRELGPAGTDLGMLLLSLGRGTLGRR